jgi:micrococcal nuclease
MTRIEATAIAAAAALLLTAGSAATARPRLDLVRAVVDGDTITLADGRRVRLVQIDAPELGGGECYSRQARAALLSLLPPGRARVRLELDRRLDRRDRYGRTLAYVFKGRENVNRTLVLRGAAAPWFYGGARGRYAGQLLAAATRAKAARRGLWGACPATALDPSHAIETRAAAAPTKPRGACDPSYPDFCIPPPPPDLDCADIRRSFRVRPPDPHRFDGEGDGIGCESYG